mmetsp:Transcript_4900/g.14963  ORF Transcript_4900/g.14963 Transcript_4900/m.14963 type:complete len:273 (+) Transcript_4900:61-879(+)
MSFSFDSEFEALVGVLNYEGYVHNLLAWAMIVTGGFAALALIAGITAPYGRFGSQSHARFFGFMVPGRLAWFLQESPALFVPLVHLLYFYPVLSTPGRILFVLFLAHYTNRALIYPLRLRTPSPTPVAVMLMALFYCLWNGYLQARSLSIFQAHSEDWLLDPRFWIGIALFLIGMRINLQSDEILRNLRKPGETGYKVPRGGIFRWVSAGNYFGESIEWLGFAVACWSLPALAFFLFTLSNLLPRARQIHKDYLRKMDDYPKDRTAFIPFLL